jgi:NADH-quinone oxidoreductase E subunit
MSLTLSEEAQAKIEEAFSHFPKRQAATLPILHILQEEFGYVSDEVMRLTAELTGTTPVEVQSTVSFYTLFKRKATGKYLLQVCRTLSCSLMGAEGLLDHLQKKLGIGEGDTTPDGKFTLMAVECLASCGTAPVMQINEDYYEKLTPEKLDQVLASLPD